MTRILTPNISRCDVTSYLTLRRHLFPAIHPMLQRNQRRYHVKSVLNEADYVSYVCTDILQIVTHTHTHTHTHTQPTAWHATMQLDVISVNSSIWTDQVDFWNWLSKGTEFEVLKCEGKQFVTQEVAPYRVRSKPICLNQISCCRNTKKHSLFLCCKLSTVTPSGTAVINGNSLTSFSISFIRVFCIM
jgi:hypothetical protein